MKHFESNPDKDIMKGRCCCKYSNEIGAGYIHIFDIIFVANIIRWVFAVWAKVDTDRVPIYARVRFLTFYLFWGTGYVYVISTSI